MTAFRGKHVNIDNSGLKAFFRNAAKNHRGLEDAAQIMGGAFVETMERFAPRDTGRYLNGWIQAGQEAGVTNLPTLSLRRTRYHEDFVDRLKIQLLRIEREIKTLEDRLDLFYGRRGLDPRRSDFGRKSLARIRLLKKRQEIAQGDMDRVVNGGAYIIIFGSAGRISAKTGRRVGERLIRLRTTVYGGSGEVIRFGGGGGNGSQVIVELRNREPHARLVEKRVRAVARTMAVARSLGIARAGNAYMRQLREATGRKAG